jgi:hypothetical protein
MYFSFCMHVHPPRAPAGADSKRHIHEWLSIKRAKKSVKTSFCIRGRVVSPYILTQIYFHPHSSLVRITQFAKLSLFEGSGPRRKNVDRTRDGYDELGTHSFIHSQIMASYLASALVVRGSTLLVAAALDKRLWSDHHLRLV